MRDRNLPKVAIFALVMILVLASLVVVFGQFRFESADTYHASFSTASRLKVGEDVRIAGMPVGKVTAVDLTADNTVDIAFTIDERYRLYTSTRAFIRYQNLIGDRYLEITSGPGELREIPHGGTIAMANTQPALDLDALLGGLRPVLKGLDGDKVNAVSGAVIELLQGQGGALNDILLNTSEFTHTLADRDQLTRDLIDNLNTVLAAFDARGAEFDTALDQLQQLITGLAQDRDTIAGAIQPLADTQRHLTDLLQTSRRPIQGVIENLRPVVATLDENKQVVNDNIDPLAENYARLNQLGAYGAFFNIYVCSVRLKFNGPAGSDILVPLWGPPDPSRGRCAL